MNGFDLAKRVEVAGMADVVHFLRAKAKEGQFVLTDKGRLAEFLQTTVGDALLNVADGRVLGVELKSEERDGHGNFFLETWSNCEHGYQKAGWMITLRSDVLLYYFVAEKRLYSIPFARLWQWAFRLPGKVGPQGRIFDFPEKPQTKYEQRNLTMGRCVPI